MNKGGLVAATVLWALTNHASAQEINREQTPPACENASTEAQYRACVDATQPGSGFHWLSLMHLGMIAMQRHDTAEAIRFFDQAWSISGENVTRPRLHGYRAVAYDMAGRDGDAVREARVALSILLRTRELPDDVWAMLGDTQINDEAAYAAILPILKQANDADFDRGLAAYFALPVENWGSAAMRASALEKLDRLNEALQMSAQALALQPEHPLVLNNHCYILLRLDRSLDALPFCERAAQAAPTIAGVRHSLGAVYAALGRCDDARIQVAEARRLDPASENYSEEIECR